MTSAFQQPTQENGQSLTLADNCLPKDLHEVCEFIRGVSFDSGDVQIRPSPGLTPILRAGNIQAKIDFENDLIWVPDAKVSREQLLQQGDIVVCMSSGSASVVGKTCQVTRDWCGSVGAFCGIIRPKAREDAGFLSHWFRSPPFIAWRDEQARGANIQNLRFSEMAKIKVPWPQAPERYRVAGQLNEQLAEVARARAAVAAQLQAAEALPAAFLRAVFSNAPALWPRHKLIEVADISAGVALGRKLRANGIRRVPYLRVANVKDGRLDLSEVKETEATESEIADCLLQYGDVLLTEGGDPDKLGRGTFWRGELPECILQNHVFRVRFGTDAEPAFMAFQFGSEYGKAYFFRHAKQTTGIATINRTVLGNFPLILPPLTEQRTIAARITAEFEQAQSLREQLAQKLAAVETLPVTLLREAFAARC